MRKIVRIPIASIRVINHRARNKARFREIVANIERIGLKRPITVSPRTDGEGYDLVCGQGRLEAYQELGQIEVPAVVLDLSVEDRYLMSLVENLARRKHPTLALVRELAKLEQQGLSQDEIGAKVGISGAYVSTLLNLLKNGEERLLRAVDRGEIPVSIAAQIAVSVDKDMQESLRVAYESGKLRGKALLRVRRLVEERRVRGKALRTRLKSKTKGGTAPTADDLVRTYRRETQRQALLVKKARLGEERLLFIESALKNLLADEHFKTLLRAEGLETMPKYLHDRLAGP